MGAFAPYQQDETIDAMFSGVAPLVPTTMHVGALLQLPDEDGLGAAEPTFDASYQRVPVSTNGGWTRAVRGATQNVEEVRFAKASTPWGTVRGAGIWDDLGNLRVIAPAEEMIEIATSDRYVLPPGAIVVRFKRGA